jgi:hypothetical protein
VASPLATSTPLPSATATPAPTPTPTPTPTLVDTPLPGQAQSEASGITAAPTDELAPAGRDDASPAATPTAPSFALTVPPIAIPGTGAAQTAPITGLTVSNKRLVATTGAPSGRRGTLVRFTAPAAGTLEFAVGRLSHGTVRHLATITEKIAPGASTLAFDGALHGRRLSPGIYALTLTLQTPGQARSAPNTIHVVIRRS